MAKTETSLEGLEDLQKKMRALGALGTAKATRRAMRTAFNIARDEAVRRAQELDDPETPMHKIWENIVIRSSSKRSEMRAGGLKLRLGVAGGAASYANTKENVRKRRVGKVFETGGGTWYWRMLEFGTENMPAQPFLLPSVTSKEGAIVESFATNLNKVLDRAIKRQANAADVSNALK